MIELTKDEAYAVADMIGSYIFDAIRADTDIDSVQWLRNLIHAYEKCCWDSGYVALTDGIEDFKNESNY